MLRGDDTHADSRENRVVSIQGCSIARGFENFGFPGEIRWLEYFDPTAIPEDSSMEHSLDGGCACGSIRYECKAEPILAYKCHCRDCQRASGSGFLALLWVPSDKLDIIANEPRYYAVNADSGRQLKRGFCPQCGSNVMVQPSFTDITFIGVYPNLAKPSGSISEGSVSR